MDRARVAEAKVTNTQDKRSPATLARVVEQFHVADNPRYQREGKTTFCNIFVWDVTTALGAPIPHWVDAQSNAPADAYAPGARELNCNAWATWLPGYGARVGWAGVRADDARSAANRGEPCIALWRNPTGGPGHVAVVLPSPGRDLRIAQAGLRCFEDEPLSHGFGSVYPITFWAAK